MSLRAGLYLSELEILEEKFGDLLQGRPLDVAYQHRHAGTECLRAGLRSQALRHYIKAIRLGDFGGLVRLAALPLPAWSWPWFRRRFLSDQGWLRDAES